MLTDVLLLLCRELCDCSVLEQWGENVSCLPQQELAYRLPKGSQQHKIISENRDSGIKSCPLCFTVQLVTNLTSRSTFSCPNSCLTSQVYPVDLQNYKYSRCSKVLDNPRFSLIEVLSLSWVIKLGIWTSSPKAFSCLVHFLHSCHPWISNFSSFMF